jgi:hypothetical protein
VGVLRGKTPPHTSRYSLAVALKNLWPDYFDVTNEVTVQNVWYRFPLIWCILGSGKYQIPHFLLPQRYHIYGTVGSKHFDLTTEVLLSR